MTSNDQPQMTSAELNAFLDAHGTSAKELDRHVIELTFRLMEKVGRPVQGEEIADYINECEPQLLAMLELIDQVRYREMCARRGRRLTQEQRREVLRMIDEGVATRVIAETVGDSVAAIYPNGTGGARRRIEGQVIETTLADSLRVLTSGGRREDVCRGRLEPAAEAGAAGAMIPDVVAIDLGAGSVEVGRGGDVDVELLSVAAAESGKVFNAQRCHQMVLCSWW